jgi:hypothetical protein
MTEQPIVMEHTPSAAVASPSILHVANEAPEQKPQPEPAQQPAQQPAAAPVTVTTTIPQQPQTEQPAPPREGKGE